MLARDFCRFESLAARGAPGPLDQLELPPNANSPVDRLTAFQAQQRRHLEESVVYARERLGIGERDRGA